MGEYLLLKNNNTTMILGKMYFYYHRVWGWFKKIWFRLAGAKLGAGIFMGPRVRLEGKVKIGAGSYLAQDIVITGAEQTTIGRKVHVAEFVSIRDADHVSTQQPRELDSKPINIGDNVWLGRGVAVLKGVTIGEGSVIGANSVVNKDIPPQSVAVGVPAQVVKEI